MNGELRIFISYRRSDCQAQANALYDGLGYRLPAAKLFMDIDSIPPGVDFEQHIKQEIEQCDLVLVMIGDNWLDPRPGTDVRRIDEPGDFVRLEVESALASKSTTIVPILVEGAPMPSPSQLPASIQRLARFNAFELSDQKWPKEIRDLAEALGKIEPATSVQLSDIDEGAVREALRDLGQHFGTRDVSEHQAIRSAHGPLSRKPSFHSVLGRYLAQHQNDLGITRLEGEESPRGALWQRQPVPSTPAPPPPRLVPTSPPPFTPPAPPQPNKPTRLTAPWVLGLATCCTAGLVAPAVPLWVASRHPHDPGFKRKMYILSAGVLLGVLVGFALIGSAPTDDEGTPVGAAPGIGTVFLLLGIAGAASALWFGHNSTPTLPGTQAEMQRRTLRAQYRRMAETDPGMALSLRVGRPDLSRDYDDGGLLHLNSLSDRFLVDKTPLRADEVRALISARESLGRFSSFEEVSGLVAGLDASSIEWLRERAVFY